MPRSALILAVLAATPAAADLGAGFQGPRLALQSAFAATPVALATAPQQQVPVLAPRSWTPRPAEEPARGAFPRATPTDSARASDAPLRPLSRPAAAADPGALSVTAGGRAGTPDLGQLGSWRPELEGPSVLIDATGTIRRSAGPQPRGEPGRDPRDLLVIGTEVSPAPGVDIDFEADVIGDVSLAAEISLKF